MGSRGGKWGRAGMLLMSLLVRHCPQSHVDLVPPRTSVSPFIKYGVSLGQREVRSTGALPPEWVAADQDPVGPGEPSNSHLLWAESFGSWVAGARGVWLLSLKPPVEPRGWSQRGARLVRKG